MNTPRLTTFSVSAALLVNITPSMYSKCGKDEGGISLSLLECRDDSLFCYPCVCVCVSLSRDSQFMCLTITAEWEKWHLSLPFSLSSMVSHTEEIEKKLTAYRKGCKIWNMLIFCQVSDSRDRLGNILSLLGHIFFNSKSGLALWRITSAHKVIKVFPFLANT